jgi:CRISPR-associated protein Cmr1
MSEVIKLEFTCTTITPLFLNGASQDESALELRPPSIKGMLRFWWRALKGIDDIEKLQEDENFMGSSNQKIGKSKFSIKVVKPSFDNSEICLSLDKSLGIAYLLYSTTMLSKRSFVKPGTKRKIIFYFYEKDNSFLNEMLYSFWCLSFLGGIGSRSRRGAGNFFLDLEKPAQNQEIANLFNTLKITTPEQLKKFFEDSISKITSEMNSESSGKYPVLKKSKIFIFDPKNDWKTALEDIGKPFRDFREKHQNEINVTPNFGIPINHRSTQTLMGAGIKNNGKVEKFLDRSASPLIFKVVQTGKGTFFPIIVWLSSSPLAPENYNIMDKKGNNIGKIEASIIDKFIKFIRDKDKRAEEVTINE